MRILLAQPHPRDVTLGSPKHFLRLGAGLEALGHEVDYLFVTDLPVAWRHHQLLYLTFPVAVLRRALQRKYDVVHVASGDAFGVAAARRGRRAARPIVINHVLGMEHIAWAQAKQTWGQDTPRPGWRHRFWTGGLRLAQVEASIRLSDRVLCSCTEDKSYMVGSGWRHENVVSIIPPGIDQIYLDAAPADLSRPTILFLGTWTPRKGIRDLALAFPAVLAAVPEARLLVAGAHVPDEVVLRDFPESVRPAVRVAPPTTEAGLVALMQECAATVLPSLYEGYGMAFAEAMALGLPVVGTPTGGMADAIQPGENGVLVPRRAPASLAEALTRLAADRDYRAQLGCAARATVQSFTWERAARDTEAVYTECLTGPRTRRLGLRSQQPPEPVATVRHSLS